MLSVHSTVEQLVFTQWRILYECHINKNYLVFIKMRSTLEWKHQYMSLFQWWIMNSDKKTTKMWGSCELIFIFVLPVHFHLNINRKFNICINIIVLQIDFLSKCTSFALMLWAGFVRFIKDVMRMWRFVQ